MADGSQDAPDSFADDSWQSQYASLEVYLQDRHNEFLAMLRFMGLIAGIAGPNDDENAVEEARAQLMEALADFLSADRGPLAEQLARKKAELRELTGTFGIESPHYYDLMNQDRVEEAMRFDALQDQIVRGTTFSGDNNLAILESYFPGGPRDPMQNAERLIGNSELSPRSNSILRQSAQLSSEIFLLEAQIKEENRRAWREWWDGVWGRVTDYYHETVRLLNNGQYLLAAGRVAIDVTYLVAEEALFAAIILALGAITGGAAAIAGAAVRAAITVVKVGIRVADDVVDAGLNAARQTAAATVFRFELRRVDGDTLEAISGPIGPAKEINVESDLWPNENVAVGEGGMGGRADPDQYPAENGNGGDGGDGDGTDRPNRPIGPRRDIDCFDVPQRANRDEFERQLAEQQDTINDMTADKLGYAHAVLDQAGLTWREQGGTGSGTDLIRNASLQDAERERYRASLVAQGMSRADIDARMRGVNATHLLDIIAGGDPKALSIGGAYENQRIGPAWTYTNTPSGTSRAEQLREAVRDMRGDGLNDHRMNVRLSAC